MKNQEKGITLIALIITIIVLMILAVVTIRAITDSGVKDYAGNAVNDYQQGETNEAARLQDYVDFIESHLPGTSSDNSSSSTASLIGTWRFVPDFSSSTWTTAAGSYTLETDAAGGEVNDDFFIDASQKNVLTSGWAFYDDYDQNDEMGGEYNEDLGSYISLNVETFTVSGGSDATNSTLIQWFLANAELVEE